ncbi:citrate:proton symporter [Bacillus sp. DX1.1]|uniref:CitMHS family transporter n=1 Tax=unclassified Bacillus (in: firmicutes) TaxID=185979 RepID=UPI00256FFBFC|nr:MULTISPECIES: citrate:proton symporter [unclassified Bacillus (in: firmicutes)]MDM5153360.1 citrate:proton symporter [Bacillus sp. DX1.1]WJE82317.1 citrate:proton symporter [Bacillus sp. DX3.1]
MLATLGFIMVFVFMFLIMTKRMSALVALILIPIVFALIGGFYADLGPMMLEGIKNLAPTGIMLMFAILYFGIMIDSGLFDPIIAKILNAVKGDPLKIVVGTAILTIIVSLDGDGTTTYMITISAMYPLYKRLGMNPLILAGVVMLGAGITNITPWGGPTARVMSSLGLDASQVFTPLIPAMIGGAIWVIFVAYFLGKKERKRLGIVDIQYTQKEKAIMAEQAATVEEYSYKRPKLLWINFLLTLTLLVCLIMEVMPLPVLFTVAFAIAVMINYPSIEEQKERIASHAGNVLAVVSLVFAAGVFTGILSGTKMVDAMANGLVALIPDALGPQLPIITAIISMPFTFFMSNDAFYFGVLPILTKAAATYGISAAEMGRASLLGQPVHLLSPLVASTYLLVGMAKVDFGEHQRFTLLWAVGTTMVMLVVAIITGVIPISF